MLGLNKREVYLSLISSAGGGSEAEGGLSSIEHGGSQSDHRGLCWPRKELFILLLKILGGVQAMGRGHGECWGGPQGMHA